MQYALIVKLRVVCQGVDLPGVRRSVAALLALEPVADPLNQIVLTPAVAEFLGVDEAFVPTRDAPHLDDVQSAQLTQTDAVGRAEYDSLRFIHTGSVRSEQK